MQTFSARGIISRPHSKQGRHKTCRGKSEIDQAGTTPNIGKGATSFSGDDKLLCPVHSEHFKHSSSFASVIEEGFNMGVDVKTRKSMVRSKRTIKFLKSVGTFRPKQSRDSGI